MTRITKIYITCPGDSSVGLFSADFAISGGDFVTEIDDDSDAEALRESIVDLFERHITGEPVEVFLEGYDQQPTIP